MDTRLFPVTPEFFRDAINPWIAGCSSKAGRPPTLSHYRVLCAMMSVLRTGIPWRDLPTWYGPWNAVYQRFTRSADRGVWWKILRNLQRKQKRTLPIVLGDATTCKGHRHGGGFKGGSKPQGKIPPVCPPSSTG